MTRKQVTVENAVWLLVFAVALAIRLLNLGASPLSEFESPWALQALSIFPSGTNVQSFLPGPQPGPIGLTGFLFYLLGSSNGLARFVPALAGALLCLAPYFFRPKLGVLAALITAAGLSLDPALVGVSRITGGPMPALGFGLFGLGLLTSGHAILAGVSLGLALLSGPAAIHGLLLLAVTWGLARLFEEIGCINNAEPVNPPLSRNRKIQAASTTLGTVLLVGTLFGYFPQGLGAWIGALPAYLSSWISVSGIPAARLLVTLLLYQPVAVIFGSLGAVIGWKDKSQPAQWLSVWFLIALLLALISPARQLFDLVWVVVPLWGLAGIFLSRWLPVSGEERPYAIIQAMAVFLLLMIFWLHLTGLNRPIASSEEGLLRWLVLLGLLLLVGISAFLVGLGWSWRAGIHGLVWGSLAALSLYSLSGLWASSQAVSSQAEIRRTAVSGVLLNRAGAIWDPSPLAGDSGLLHQTIGDLSTWSTGRKEATPVLVAVDSPSLRWLLRSYPNARFVTERQTFTSEGSAPIILTRKVGEDPVLSANYRGQDFTWWVQPEWAGALPANVPLWLAYHQLPEAREEIILWGRADLFPGVTLSEEQPEPAEVEDSPVEPTE